MKEISLCFKPDGNYKKGITLSKEILPILQKIYGQYHIIISCHMFRHARILLENSMHLYTGEDWDFYEKTKHCIKITHGVNNPLYHLCIDIGIYL